MRRLSLAIFLIALLSCQIAWSSVIDTGPPQDANGNWLFDIYNSSGVERGTASVPFRIDPTGTTAQPVTGTFWQATQPISGSVGRTWSLLNTTDSVNVGNFPSTYPVTGVFWQTTQPISAAALPLPSGAATAANQATGNTTLATISGGIPAALGQTTMAASMPVTMASNQSPISVSVSGGTVTSVTGYGSLAAYSATAVAFVPAAAATDVFVIKGSATKTVRISLISISATTTAGSGFAINETLVKRTAANSGGTFVTLVPTTHDSSDSASTAVVGNYTANPTSLGASSGVLRGIRQTISTAGVVNNITTWDFGTRPAKPIVLRGTSESLCINFGGATITGPIATIYVEYTEE